MHRLYRLASSLRHIRPLSSGTRVLAVLVVVTAAVSFIASARALPPVPCTLPDNGSFTADMPPGGCNYVSLQSFVMLNGLPPGEPVLADLKIHAFANVVWAPGGSLGGEMETFDANLEMEMTGSGSLAAFHRIVSIPVSCRCDAAPRTPGVAVQSFAHDVIHLQGQITGDPDFDLLRITAGSSFGLPSPGHTTLTLAGPSWSVDSFFDITYRVDFIGHPGGPLGGMSGSTTGTIRMQAGTPGTVPNEESTWGGVKGLYR